MTARAFMAHRAGNYPESEVLFQPIPPDHPLFNVECPECTARLGSHVNPESVRLRIDWTELHRRVAEDLELQRKYHLGHKITAPAEVIHESCAVSASTVTMHKTVTVVRDV